MKRTILVLSALVPLLSWAGVVSDLEANEGNAGVSAVQDRQYRLQNEINIGVGTLPLDAFTKSYYAQGAYVLHFTDSFAWEVGRFAYALNVNTSLRDQLQRDFGLTKNDFDPVQFFVGSDLLWKPLYGKLSLLNRFQLHGEAFILAGGTLFKFQSSFRAGVNLGGGLRLFLSRMFSLRFDVTDTIVAPGGKQTGLGNVLTLTLSVGFNFRLIE